MAFTGRAPESLLPRSDSKNPATTCKGITKSGRPCRRAIDTSVSARHSGVLAVASVVSDEDGQETEAAVFFCWQHKDQAEHLTNAHAAEPSGQGTQLYPLQERNSIDTLVARLGVLEIEDNTPQRRRKPSRQEDVADRLPRRVKRPPTWDQVQGPVMSVPSDIMTDRKRRTNQRLGNGSLPEKPGFWASLCCGTADDDYVEVVRHKRRTQASVHASESSVRPTVAAVPRPQEAQSTHRRRSSNTSSLPSPSGVPARKPLGDKAAKPLNKTSSRPSETSMLLSYIPKTIPPQTASALLAELSKPISQHDEEGYIYIFWLTPESLGPAPSSTASDLLTPPTRPEQGRRTSDVLRQYSVRRPQRPQPDGGSPRSGTKTTEEAENNTILLKIGRANNVTRRMNEWTRQCGYSLSLVRWYPYVPSTPSPSPQGSPAHSRRPSYNSQRPADPTRRVSEGVRKVPHAHRVERLIHIELASQRVMKKCDACGKDHREWFEVQATRDGVKNIDEVVKRWVSWAERANE